MATKSRRGLIMAVTAVLLGCTPIPLLASPATAAVSAVGRADYRCDRLTRINGAQW
jgi:hypothetical protein